MHYYIDGYNLLFRTAGGPSSDLRSQRESLIQSLNVKIASLKLDVTIVFDSQYFEGEGSRSHYKHLEICFTPLGMTADEFILEQLKFCRSPQHEIVVTSDRDLAYKSRNLSAATQNVDEFLGWLNKRFKKKGINATKLPPAIASKKEVKNEVEPAEITEEKPKLPPEGTMEFYLMQFETRYEHQHQNDTKNLTKSAENPKHKKRKITPIIENSHLSDEERWLKIFEERLKEK